MLAQSTGRAASRILLRRAAASRRRIPVQLLCSTRRILDLALDPSPRRVLSSSSSAAVVPKASTDDTPAGEDQLPAKLIDFQTQAVIEGEESHIATIQLQPGEALRAESGAMIFMTEGVVSE